MPSDPTGVVNERAFATARQKESSREWRVMLGNKEQTGLAGTLALLEGA
jgi:hypothetical protein